MTRHGVDKPLILATLALLAMGLATLYSAGQTDAPSAAAEIWKNQLTWLGLGVVAGVAFFRISPRILEWATPFIFAVALGLLGLTLLVGTGAGTAAGAKSWLAIGGVRIGQPVELAKLAVIFMLARHLGSRREPPNTLLELMPACVIVGVPFVLVGLQPDLGSAMVFLGILFAMLFWVGVAPHLLLLLASPVISLLLAFSTAMWGAWIVVLTLLLLWMRPYLLEGLGVWMTNVLMGVIALELWSNLAPYQQNRLLSFLNPEIDPRATGWHIIQSKIAIGSGGLVGKGFLDGSQKRLAFLPAQHTDFIYSVLGEEVGFIGVLLSLTVFATFLLILARIARRATDPFSSMVIFGIVGLFLTHILVNIGMTVGLMPITGIPLPFFSYGGSFLITSILCVALALRVAWDSRGSGYLEM